MTPMAREHREALAAIGGWSIADCLAYPEFGIAHLKTSGYGGTHLPGEQWPEGTGFQCARQGIHIGGGVTGGLVLFTITWTALAAYARTLTERHRRALKDVRARGISNQQNSPEWLRGEPDWVFHAWYRDVYQPHLEEYRAIREAEVTAIRAALGLDEGEQLDLFS
jgi:hypothetical protein